MAYTDYTPDPGAIHTTVTIPDDAELETSGVGAVNTALEQLADRTDSPIYQFLGTRILEPKRYTISAFTVTDTITPTVIKDTLAADCTLDLGTRMAGDYVSISATCQIATGVESALITLETRLGVFAWSDRHIILVADNTTAIVPLHCTILIPASFGGIYTARVTITNAASPSTTIAYEELMFTGHVWRPLP